MDEMNMDRALRETLHTCADELRAPEKLKTRVDFAIKSGVKPARSKMKTWKRTALAVCAVLAIVVTSVLASGTGMIEGHSWTNQRMDLADSTALAQQISSETKVIEGFANGFSFDYGSKVETTATNGIGQSEDVVELSVWYKKDDVKLILDMHRPYTVFSAEEQDKSAPQATAEVDGVALAFRDTQYLFVPADYQLTAEQERARNAGEIVVSYGSDEIASQRYQSAAWEQDGVCYTIGGFETGLTADDFFAMAAEVIGK